MEIARLHVIRKTSGIFIFFSLCKQLRRNKVFFRIRAKLEYFVRLNMVTEDTRAYMHSAVPLIYISMIYPQYLQNKWFSQYMRLTFVFTMVNSCRKIWTLTPRLFEVRHPKTDVKLE